MSSDFALIPTIISFPILFFIYFLFSIRFKKKYNISIIISIMISLGLTLITIFIVPSVIYIFVYSANISVIPYLFFYFSVEILIGSILLIIGLYCILKKNIKSTEEKV